MQTQNEKKNKNKINNLVINEKMLFDFLEKFLEKNDPENLNEDNPEEKNITKDDIEKEIVRCTIAKSETKGNNGIYKSRKATSSNINNYLKGKEFKQQDDNNPSEEDEKRWQYLYSSLVFGGYVAHTSEKIYEIDKDGKIKYGVKSGNKTIDLSKTGFSETISIILARNALMYHWVDKKAKQKITEESIINPKIREIAEKGINTEEEAKEQAEQQKSFQVSIEYQKELVKTFLSELKKYPKGADYKTIKDVLAIVCKEISANPSDLIIELTSDKELEAYMKNALYYYFYKQKLEELNKVKGELEDVFKKRDEYFKNVNENIDKRKNIENIFALDDGIKEKIIKIKNIRQAFIERCKEYKCSENDEDYKNFSKNYIDIFGQIQEQNDKVLDIGGDFKKLGVGFIKGKTIEYEKKAIDFNLGDEIEGDFKTKFKNSVLGAIAYIGDDGEKNIDSDSKIKEELNLLKELLGLIANESGNKWIQQQYKDEDIKDKIKRWKPTNLENKTLFAALTYYDEKKKPVVNFISRGELKPTYSYIEYEKETYKIFMIPEKNEEKVEPKYYVFDTKGVLVKEPPFTIKHNIVDCEKVTAYYKAEDKVMEFNNNNNNILRSPDIDDGKNNVVDNKNDKLSKLLKDKYIENDELGIKPDSELGKYREIIEKDALFIDNVVTADRKNFEKNQKYKPYGANENEENYTMVDKILERKGKTLEVGEGIFR